MSSCKDDSDQYLLKLDSTSSAIHSNPSKEATTSHTVIDHLYALTEDIPAIANTPTDLSNRRRKCDSLSCRGTRGRNHWEGLPVEPVNKCGWGLPYICARQTWERFHLVAKQCLVLFRTIYHLKYKLIIPLWSISIYICRDRVMVNLSMMRVTDRFIHDNFPQYCRFGITVHEAVTWRTLLTSHARIR